MKFDFTKLPYVWTKTSLLHDIIRIYYTTKTFIELSSGI